MNKSTLLDLVSKIKTEKKPVTISPRELFEAFGYERRTKNNCCAVDRFLTDNDMIVDPNYSSVWIDDDIILKHKDVAVRREAIEPVKQLQVLRSSKIKPIVVDKNDKLSKALTLMQYNNYSQLPVISSSMKNIIGYISWQSIGIAIMNGIKSDNVKDYISTEYCVCKLDTPLLEAIQLVLSNEFVLVINSSKDLCGIVTTSDISQQYILWTKPFVLLEEIENQIRYLLEGKFLLEDIQKVCQESNRKVCNLDDLTFGEYIAFLQHDKNWDKLNLDTVNKSVFIGKLEEIRLIRNDVMHFEPAGLTDEQISSLACMSNYLRTILKFNNPHTVEK